MKLKLQLRSVLKLENLLSCISKSRCLTWTICMGYRMYYAWFTKCAMYGIANANLAPTWPKKINHPDWYQNQILAMIIIPAIFRLMVKYEIITCLVLCDTHCHDHHAHHIVIVRYNRFILKNMITYLVWVQPSLSWLPWSSHTILIILIIILIIKKLSPAWYEAGPHGSVTLPSSLPPVRVVLMTIMNDDGWQYPKNICC